MADNLHYSQRQLHWHGPGQQGRKYRSYRTTEGDKMINAHGADGYDTDHLWTSWPCTDDQFKPVRNDHWTK